MALLKNSSVWKVLHVYAAVVFSIPLFILAVSGFILAFGQEINSWEEPARYNLKVKGKPLNPSEVIELVRKHYPAVTFHHISIPEDPKRAYMSFTSIGTGADRRRAKLYIDPFKEKIMVDGKDSNFYKFVRHLHKRLFISDWGKTIVGVCSIGMFVITLSGIIIWLPRWRMTFKRVKHMGDALSWHNFAGAFLGIIALTISFTGATYGFGYIIHPMVRTLTLSPPPAANPESSIGPRKITLPEAISIVQAGLKPNEILATISEPPPGKPAKTYKFMTRVEGKNSLLSQKRYWIDQHTGKVLQTHSLTNGSAGQIYQDTFWAVHTGYIFGDIGRYIWGIAAGAGPVFFIITGLLWYRRKRGAWPPFGLIKKHPLNLKQRKIVTRATTPTPGE